jgi:hypothetical protein
MPAYLRQIHFFPDIHNKDDSTVIRDRGNFFNDYPQFAPTDEPYSYTDLREGTMTLQEFIAYFGNNYRLTATPYLIVYDFYLYKNDHVKVFEKRICIV